MAAVLKAAVAYLVILFAIRPIGRRTASQAAPLDMVVLFLFGAMTGAAILGEDRSFTAAMTSVFTVGLMHVLVGWLKLKSQLAERIVDGTPIVVFEEGRWSEDKMRQQGLNDLDKVQYAIVERDGQISIIPKEKK